MRSAISYRVARAKPTAAPQPKKNFGAGTSRLFRNQHEASTMNALTGMAIIEGGVAMGYDLFSKSMQAAASHHRESGRRTKQMTEQPAAATATKMFTESITEFS